MTNRLCDTEIWEKDWFLDLNTKQKLLVKFLFDRCDCAGFYQISWNLLRVYFNDVEITKEDFEKIKQIKFIDKDLIFIEDFALFQCKVRSFDELNEKNKAHLGVLRLLKKYHIFEGKKQSPFEAPLKPLESPFEGVQEKEQEKDKEQEYTHTNKKDISFSYSEEEKKEKKEKIYGECFNVHLTKSHYAKLLNEILSQKVLNELIDELSLNIARGKAPPYSDKQPDCHYACLKVYWRSRKQRENNPTAIDKAKAFKENLDKLTEQYRLKEAESG